MKTNNFLIFGLFALAFYWLYQRGKQQTHTETATAAAAEAGITLPGSTNTVTKTVEVIKYVPVGSAATPWKKPIRDTQIFNNSFTLAKTKTPFVYEA